MQNTPPYEINQAAPYPQAGMPIPVRLPAKKPTVTYTLIGVTAFIYLLQYLSQTFAAGGYDWPLLFGAKINDLILRGQVWRLLTPALLHGSVLHIAFNMYALYSLGISVERYFGHRKFLLLYAIGAFCGNALSFLLSPNSSVGASTAVFGLVAAEGVFIFRNRKMYGSRARSMLTNLVLIVVVNLILGLQPGIDNWGHLGGLAGGALFAWFAGPIMQVQTTSMGYELADSRSTRDTWLGFLVSTVPFLAMVIAKFLIQ